MQKKSIDEQMKEWNELQRQKRATGVQPPKPRHAPLSLSGIFRPISSREDAIATTRAVGIAFLFFAGLILISVYLNPLNAVDVVILAGLGGWLWKWKSRVAAVLLTLISLANAGVTVLNLMGIMNTGGRNLLVAIAAVLCAAKGVEATFKYHGRFKAIGPQQSPPPYSSPAAGPESGEA